MTLAENELTARALEWASTMEGVRRLVRRRPGRPRRGGGGRGFSTSSGGRIGRRRRTPGWRQGAPGREAPAGGAWREEPDALRTCFERDRDRILHSAAFRRLAGKTQVFVFPADHQRTRLTHALEVAQVATAIARACRLNVALCEAIALGHDCGHGPGGHASEDALSPFVDGGFRPRRLGRRRDGRAAQPLHRDPGRDPQPLLVAARPRHAGGRGRGPGRPDRLHRSRPRGRRPRRDRGRGRRTGVCRRALWPDEERAAPVLHRRRRGR